MLFIRSFHFLIIFVVVGGCIDPLPLKNSSSTPSLVVDGLITDQPGPYIVKLHKTNSIYNQLDTLEAVRGAKVTLVDDVKGHELLKETSAGQYETSSTLGVVGRTYSLLIITTEGYTYKSLPETLTPAGDISNLSFAVGETGVQVTMDAHLLASQNHMARWRWTGTFEIRTTPELKITTQIDAVTLQEVDVPTPPFCSGYVYATDSTGQKSLQKKRTCTCCLCWANQYSDLLLTDKNSIKDDIEDIKLALIPVNPRYFYDKYYLEVEQLSCSPAVYEFWEKVLTQRTQGSDLFQTPPAVTSGNIVMTSAEGLPVIGIFSAAAIRKQSIVIQRNNIPYMVPPVDFQPVECYTLYAGSTTVKPSFW